MFTFHRHFESTRIYRTALWKQFSPRRTHTWRHVVAFHFALFFHEVQEHPAKSFSTCRKALVEKWPAKSFSTCRKALVEKWPTKSCSTCRKALVERWLSYWTTRPREIPGNPGFSPPAPRTLRCEMRHFLVLRILSPPAYRLRSGASREVVFEFVAALLIWPPTKYRTWHNSTVLSPTKREWK